MSTAHSCVMDLNDGLTRDEVLRDVISIPTDPTTLAASSDAFSYG